MTMRVPMTGGCATTHRAFCGDCGSPLFGNPERRPEMRTVRVGSLDDPSPFRPTHDIFTDSAQPWDHMDPSRRKFPRLPD